MKINYISIEKMARLIKEGYYETYDSLQIGKTISAKSTKTGKINFFLIEK